MKHKKKIIIIAIIVILAAIFVLARFKSVTQFNWDKPTVTISATIPLTGNIAQVGNDLQKAMLLAQSEIPTDTKYNYEFVIADDAYEYKKTALNVNKFISINKADAVLSLYDGAGAVIAPIADNNELLHINCAWGEKLYQKYKYTFNHYSKPKTQAKAFIDNLVKNNVKSFSIISINYASINEAFYYIEGEAYKAGIKILSKKLVNFGAKDFRTDIMKLKKENPDRVMVLMLNPELDIFGKQAKELNLNIPYTSIDLVHGTAHPEFFENTEFVLSSRGSDEFISKMGGKTEDSCSARFYDSIKIITNIYEKIGDGKTKPSSKDVVKELHKIKNYPSAIGTNISVDSDGIIDAGLKTAIIIDGKVEMLGDK